MKISFDNLRKNIAADFNALVQEMEHLGDECSARYLKEYVNSLRGSIGGLLACYDSKEMPDDFNDLSGEIELLEL